MVAACVFDAYGTLFDVHSAVRCHADRLGPTGATVSQLRRSRQLEYTWLRTLMDRYVDFATVTTDALDVALATHGVSDPELRSDLLRAYLELVELADEAGGAVGNGAQPGRVPQTMTDQSEIVVYWRPGCGFCARLFRHLEAGAVPHRRVNIWDDERAAAAVRQVASGNETVPTVFVGTVALVNPSLDQLLTVASTEAPAAVPVGWKPKPPGWVARWLARRLAASDG